MYHFIIDDMELPIPPAKLQIKTGNKNKTVELVSIGEVNILKSIGLQEFSFDILLPKEQYHFVAVQNEFKQPLYYINKLQKLKAEKRYFTFEIIRLQPNGTEIFTGSINASLEEYTVKENAGEEGDFWVSLNLKEYRMPKTKVIKIQEKNEETGIAKAVEETERETKATVTDYTVAKGDTLWAIAKKELNDGSRYKEIAALNNIKDANKIVPGQVLNLP